MKFAKTMPKETVRDLTQSEMDHASPLFTPFYGEEYESRKSWAFSGYSSDTGSESSDCSIVMSTRPEMRKPEMRGASIYMSGRTTHRESGISIGADLGLNTSDGFRKIITPEISKVVKYTPFPDDDHEIKPNFSGDFFDRYSDDPEEKKNRVRSRWSFFVSETLAISNIVKYNEVVQAINWARWANALFELDNQKAVSKNNKHGLLKKGMQVVSTGAGLGLGAAATTVQTGWSFGKAVVGAVVGLGKKPDQTRPQQTRTHTRFDESGDGKVVEEVVVRSENQMQADLRAENDREMVSSMGGRANGAPNASTPLRLRPMVLPRHPRPLRLRPMVLPMHPRPLRLRPSQQPCHQYLMSFKRRLRLPKKRRTRNLRSAKSSSQPKRRDWLKPSASQMKIGYIHPIFLKRCHGGRRMERVGVYRNCTWPT